MKHFSAKELLDSKKFNITVMAVNLVLIVVLASYLLISHSHFQKMSQTDDPGNNDATTTQEEVDQKLAEADSDVIEIYSMLLENSDFDLGEGIEFHFGSNGVYSGYFDAKNTSVENYSYEICLEDNKRINLVLYNPDKSKYVKYEMTFDENGNIVLTYPELEQSIVLEY